MRIAIGKAYSQEFYADAPQDLKVGDTVFVQYGKDKKASAEIVAVGEYADDDKLIQLLLVGKSKKNILGKIVMFKENADE